MSNVIVLPVPKLSNLPKVSIIVLAGDLGEDGCLGDSTVRICDHMVEFLNSGRVHPESPVLVSTGYSPQRRFATKEAIANTMSRYLRRRGVLNTSVARFAWGVSAEVKSAMHAIVKQNLPKDVILMTSYYQFLHTVLVVNALTCGKLMLRGNKLKGTFAGHFWNFSIMCAPALRISAFQGLWKYLRCLFEIKKKFQTCPECKEATIPLAWKSQYVVVGAPRAPSHEQCWVCWNE